MSPRLLSLAAALLLVCGACGATDEVIRSPTSTITAESTTPETSVESPTTGTQPASSSTSTTQPEPMSTVQPEVEHHPSVLVANSNGVFQVEESGSVERLVTGTVSYAIDDTLGGMLFQIDRGRDWDDFLGDPNPDWSTEVWWVPKGRSTAREILVPTPGAGHSLTLYDSFATGDSFGVVYLRHEGEEPPFDGNMADSLRVYDQATGTVSELYRVRGWEWNLDEISAGDGVVVATETMLWGGVCRLLDLDGESVSHEGIPTASEGCFGEHGTQCPTACALASDGSRVAYIDWRRSESSEPRAATLVFATFEDSSLETFDISLSDGWWPEALDVAGDTVLVNRRIDGEYSLPALLFDASNPAGQPIELPVAGMARFVTHGVDIDGPVNIRALLASADYSELVLRADGLGKVNFGDPVDVAMEKLIEILGEPSPGEEYPLGDHPLRHVYWEEVGLAVVFSDYEFYRDDGLEHLAGWSHGSQVSHLADWDEDPKALPLKTSEGIGIGFTLAELRAAYPERVVLEPECDPGSEATAAYVKFDDPVDGPGFVMRFGFAGKPLGPNSRIASMSSGAGPGC